MSANQDAVDMLNELIELVTLDEGSPQSFRVRAYESARHTIEAYGGDISKLDAAALAKLDGIGKSTASKLRELFDVGKVDKLEGLRKKHPASVVALMRLPGVGPKAVARLRAELGVQNIDDLKKALEDQKLRDLKGFGIKSEEKIKASLARLSKEGGDKRTPISVALPLARRIVGELSALEGVVASQYCGSLRRFSETVGDLDIVVATLHGAPVMEHVVNLKMVEHVLVRGDTKTSVVTRRGLQIDVRVVKPNELGAALMYFTGSKSHNIKLRMRALEQKMTLNEYALAHEDGRVVASETEEEIYRALGLPWIHPVLREDMGELDLAESASLPDALTNADIHGDFHVHTSLSGDAETPLVGMVDAAIARGYSVVAITEHAEGLALSGVKRDAIFAQRAEIAALQKKLGDKITLLHGVELNIGPKGELDYDRAFRASFDFCLASIHDHFDLDKASQTARVVAAMNDPSVNMIGHLTARMIGGRPPVELDVDAILDAAEKTKTALEVNGGLPRLDLPVSILRQARDRNVDLVLTSDAHRDDELDRVEHACLNVLKAGVRKERVVNTWDRKRILSWVRNRRASASA
jgi:DNA polymerase (family X)